MPVVLVDIDSKSRSYIPCPPVFPVEIQLHIIASLYSRNDDLEEITSHRLSLAWETHQERLNCLWSWSLVCRVWRLSSQPKLFSFVIVGHSIQLDQLHHILRHPTSFHLAQHINYIKVVYHPPYYKIGEILQRVISMKLSNLIGICFGAFGAIPPSFQLRPSLLAQASRLRTVRYLWIFGYRFRHRAELRRLLSVFQGAISVSCSFVSFGVDRMGDFRSLQQTISSDLREVEFYSLQELPVPYPFWWIAPSPSSDLSRRPFHGETQKVDIHPFISSSIASLLRDLVQGMPTFLKSTIYCWKWELRSEDEWTLELRTSHSKPPPITVHFIKWRPSNPNDSQSYHNYSFDFDHVKQINFTPNDHDHGSIMSHVYSLFRPLVPKFRQLGVLNRMWLNLVSQRQNWATLSDVSDGEIVSALARLLQEAEGVHITVGGMPLQHLLKEQSKAREGCTELEREEAKADVDSLPDSGPSAFIIQVQ